MTTLTIKKSRLSWKKQDFQNERELLEYLLEREGKVIINELAESEVSAELLKDLVKLKTAKPEDIVDFRG